MPEVGYFLERAQRCRELVDRALNPEVAEQLRQWAEEFEELAAETARRTQRDVAPRR